MKADPKVLDQIVAKPDSEPLTDVELEQLFIYEFGEVFELYDDGTWI